ncbi:MAG: LamG-like jellyroll fold domain-containing protein [Acidobacteriota bacterium]
MPCQNRPKGWRIVPVGCVLAALAAAEAATADNVQVQPNRRILATTEFVLTGLAVKAEPAQQDVPRHTATVIKTRLAGVEGDATAILSQLNGSYRVRGQLLGPSLTSPLELDAAIGAPLVIPPLALPGDHLVTNLRVVDTSLAGSPAIAEVLPETCSVSVLDQLLVSQVQVHELTYEEILATGLNVSQDSYSYYSFTLAVGTESDGYKISIPVAMPRTGEDPPIAGPPQSTASVGTVVPAPDVLAVLLEPEGAGGGAAPELEGGTIRIPGLIVFPGRIAFLHQFFEAILIVSNGAPADTPLVVHSLRARLELPQASNPLDNPLRVAELQLGGPVEELELHALGPDGTYGTQDDTTRFAPGESGQAAFLIEGLKDGLHTIKFKLQGTLEGLPSGPVIVRGEAAGAVRVRDASFAVSFTHPGIVRAGREYDLGVTLFNSGSRDILAAFADLSPLRISGAELVDPALGSQRSFPATLKPGESGTVTWRLRAQVTGAVTASFRKVEGASETCLELVTGVGDRNVPLSPDSLILPDTVRYLPPPVIQASAALLGQAWSIATAPFGSLPEGALPISKQTVLDRAVGLGIAGLRVRLDEPLAVSLVTLLRDWLGETEETPDLGFMETLCSTPTGFDWQDRLGEQLSLVPAPDTAGAFHRAIAENELARSRFLSVLVSHAEAPPFLGVRLLDPEGRAVGSGEPPDRFGAVPAGSMLRLDTRIDGQSNSRGAFLLASNPASGFWTLELVAWQAGLVDISILLPVDGDLYRQLLFSGVALAAGGMYRVRFNPYFSSGGSVEQCAVTCSPLGPTGVVELVQEPPPRLVGALQIGPPVMEAGDRFGRMAALLFSKPVLPQTAENLANYAIGGGTLVGSQPPTIAASSIRVSVAKPNFGNRFVFLKPSSPIGPLIERMITLTGITDTRGQLLSPPATDIAIEMTVSPDGSPPGGYLTGRVLNADGTPVAGADVELYDWPCAAVLPVKIAGAKTDSGGRYGFDYVVNGECAPLSAISIHPTTGSQKQFSLPVLYHGQRLVADFVFLARGRVQGEITLNGQSVPGAQVQIMSNSDPTVVQLAHADSNGKYLALDIPVGGVSVLAVGPENQANATGFGAGWIDGPGQTATVDVALQSISGVISGQVTAPDGSPVSRMLVVAETRVPGIDDPVTLGFCYTTADGKFLLSNLPLAAITVYATDYATQLRVSQEVQLTGQTPSVSGVVLALPGYGSVSGRVVDRAGNFVPMAEVRCGFAFTTADPLGYYTLPMIVGGTHDVLAVNTVTGLEGSTRVTVWPGQETAGANIVISAAGMIKGTVSIVRTPGLPPVPLPGVRVSHNGLKVVSTDSEGTYLLPNVPPGVPFVLRFVDPSGRLGVNQVVQLSPGETLIRNLTFHPAAIGGKVFQPDGQTGAVARISLYVPHPNLAEGPLFGLLDTERPISTVTEADGAYFVSTLNPAGFRIVASSAIHPTPVGRVGALLPDGLVTCDLTLVDSFAGTIKGRVFKPDGVTPVGEGAQVTLGGGYLADAMTRTDADGFYAFPEVFASGTYHLTAADPVTGYSNRLRISVVENQDSINDIRLLGRGSVRTRVIDAAGVPVESGAVTVTGLDYPNASDQAGLAPGSGGALLFENLPEGPYAVVASRQGLSGRVCVSIPQSGTVEVTVQLQSAGAVTGRVLMPDGVTPVGLADVRLILAGRAAGYTVTSDEAENRGTFSFPDVPLGDFKLEAFDNRSTRIGRTAGRLTQNGETTVADIILVPIGTVRGRVTANSAPVDHAFVTLQAGGLGFSQSKLKATTDAAGNYQFPGVPAGSFTLQATHPASGLTGSAEGILNGGQEPLPDTIVNISLEQSASIEGVVFDHQGGAVAGAQVTVTIGSRTLTCVSRSNGSFRLDYVPLGEAMVEAEAPSGYDRGRSGPVLISQAGSTTPVEVRFDGVGTVKGDAFDGDGVTRLALGTVTLTNTEWRFPVILACPVDQGTYEIQGVPAGPFSLKLTVPNRTTVGAAAATLAADQILSIPLTLEPAGSVTGKVVRPDGTTPAVGADVTVRVARPSGGAVAFTSHTDSAGIYRLDQVLLGSVEIWVEFAESRGLAAMSGLSLSANGELLQVPLLVLDEEPIAVESVSPANGSLGVPRSTAVTVTFTEPARPATVNESSFKLLNGATQVEAAITLAPEGLAATLTPVQVLADNATFTVVVTTEVTDMVGRRLPAEFRSTFRTPDETPPVVVSLDPPAGATQVAPDRVIHVTFDEALDPQQSWAGVVRLFPDGRPQALVPLIVSLSESGKTLVAQPSEPLAGSTLYRLEVTAQKDLAGNLQAALYTASFSTEDRTKPVIDSVPVEGQMLFTSTPLLVATYRDDFSGIDTASLTLSLDGRDVRAGAQVSSSEVRYQVPAVAPLTPGSHSLTVQVSDKVGNQSDAKVALFQVDDVPPQITSFTIAGQPAFDGMTVTVFRPVFTAYYSDNGEVAPAETRLFIGIEGEAPVEVPAAVTKTALVYQPSSDLSEAAYVVQLVVTDGIGNSTTTGPIRLFVDVDAPEITTAAPLFGSQHGGTLVVMEGARLLQPDGSAPVVTVGGNPAFVVACQPGPPESVAFVTPPGRPGLATLRVQTERGVGTANTFFYEADSGMPPALEDDTLLLWRLDEAGPGTATIVDSGPFGIGGTGSAASQAVPGRFGLGRSGKVEAGVDQGILSLGSSSFTLECWLKTGPISRTYVLAGKDASTWAGSFSLSLKPSGAVWGYVRDMANHFWETVTDPSLGMVTDGQWHHAAMTVDRQTGLLRLYVDGAERASSSQPAGFGEVSNMSPFAVGRYDAHDWSGGPSEFPGVIDEVRLSANAHSAARIQEVMLGRDGPLALEVTRVQPDRLIRGASAEILISGYNLAGLEAEGLDPSGQNLTVEVLGSSATSARVRVEVPSSGPSGDAELRLRSDRGDTVVRLLILDPVRSAAALEENTLLLMHFEEPQGQQRLLDSGPFSLDAGISDTNAYPGLVGTARRAALLGDYDAGVLALPDESFTVEAWMKASRGATASFRYLTSTYCCPSWQLDLTAAGGLQATVTNGAGQTVEAVARPIVSDLQTGRSFSRNVADDQWHHVAMVLDRSTGLLSVFIDGRVAQSAAVPPSFGRLRESTSGSHYTIGSTGSSNARVLVDEFRISFGAHSQAKIWQDYSGDHPAGVASVLPFAGHERRVLNRGLRVPITLNGFGLTGLTAEIRRGGAAVPASVIVGETSYGRARLEILVDPQVSLGAADLVLLLPSVTEIVVPIDIIESRAPRVESDSVLLWRLDEPGAGRVQLQDATGAGSGGQSGNSSAAVEGRFGGARKAADGASLGDGGTLDFGDRSFTVETWFRAPPLTGDSVIFGRGTSGFLGGYYLDWGLSLLVSGGLRAILRDTQNTSLVIDMAPLRSSPTGLRKTVLLDDTWHQAALVVSREAGQIDIYVDGVKEFSAPIPSGFGPLRNQPGSVFQLGYLAGNYSDPAAYGIVDDTRVSVSARTAEKIWQDFSGLGPSRITRVWPLMIQRNRNQALETEVTVEGYHLGGLTAQLSRNQVSIHGVSVEVYPVSELEARLAVSVPAQVPLGPADLVLSLGGTNVTWQAEIAEPGPLPRAAHTALLWHMENSQNGAVPLSDSGPFRITATSAPESLSDTGRFGLGRKYAGVQLAGAGGPTDIGWSDFTLECWLRTGAIGRSYILAGKAWSWSQGGYALVLLPSGILRARLADTSGLVWKTEISPVVTNPGGSFSVKPLLDDEWHLVGMSVDRKAGLMTVYIDGAERGSTPMPAGFGPVSPQNYLCAGVYDPSEGGVYGGMAFPGILDDVRLSLTAYQAAEMATAFFGSDTPMVTEVVPALLPRGSTNALISLHGAGLAGATVRSENPSILVQTEATSPQQVDVRISLPGDLETGPVSLVVEDPVGRSGAAVLMVTAPQPFANPSVTDGDTLVLWRLDDERPGQITFPGAGDLIPNAVGATSSAASLAVGDGVFGYARRAADLVADAGFNGAEPVTSSFTVQCWMRTQPVDRPYNLVGRSDAENWNTEFGVALLATGGLRAYLYDAENREWTVESRPAAYDPTAGIWNNCIVDDGRWHLVSMVVDRAASQLLLYVDGELQASAAAPPGFAGLRNYGKRFRAGYRNLAIPGTWGSAEFPGDLDEIRVVARAVTVEEIRADFGLPPVSWPSAWSVAASGQQEAHSPTAGRPVARTNEQPFENHDEAQTTGETVLLWHLDEQRNGSVRLVGAGDPVPEVIAGTASTRSIAEAGRFAGGRTYAGIVADPDGGALDFGASSFTLDFWLRSDPVFSTYTLAGRDGPWGEAKDFGVSLLPSGRLKAWLYDTSGREWAVESVAAVDDSVWRLITLCVDREAGWLYVLVDDALAAAAPCPAGFGAVANQGQRFRAGHLDAYGPATFAGPVEFPGVLDELRVLNYARKPAELSK